MNLKTLWAPWRLEYILSPPSTTCIFCEKPQQQKDEENYIVYRSKYSYIILNAYPYNSGHFMVVPYKHVEWLEQLTEAELRDLIETLIIGVRALKAEYKPDGLNIGINIGKAAGAGLEHLHIHVVPRWVGDTNYMPVLADTKVVSEHIREAYKRLKIAIEREARQKS